MPTTLDLAFAFLFAVVLTAYETVYEFPRFKAKVMSGDPKARRNGYRRTAIGQWVIAGIALVLWIRAGRPWDALGLVPPRDAGVVSVALVAIMVALAVHQALAIRRASAEKRAALRPRLAFVEFLLPHTRDEYHWFTFLSCTAGVCEELLYRGYLTWVLRAYIGLPAAIVAVVVLFAAGHAYQGLRGALKAGGAAVAMSLIVVATGWLIPAMVVHALIDASAGLLGYKVLSEPGPAPSLAASA